MSTRQFRSVLFLVFVTGALGAACANGTSEPDGGGNGGGGNGGGTELDVTGSWDYTLDVTVATGDCAGEEAEDNPPQGSPEMGTASFVQSGNAVTATAFWGSDDGMQHDLDGSISGNTVTVTGSYPEDGGTTTRTLILDVNSDGTSMTGREEWSWTDGTLNCPNGEATVSATKQ